MESLTLDPGVYIRSMATRGALGGLASTTREVCDVVDAFGFDRIVVETVGVGQSELEIAGAADTAILVLVPESGDGVQVLKAGIMEIADIYVVNKSDRPGADKVRQEIEVMLGIRAGNAFRHVRAHHAPAAAPKNQKGGSSAETSASAASWSPPVVTTVAFKGEGLAELTDTIEGHAAFLKASGELERRRRIRLERHTREVVDRSLRQRVWQEGLGEAKLARGLDQVARGEATPYQLARDIVAGLDEEGQI
jgi:LAO/AO transport system kinase